MTREYAVPYVVAGRLPREDAAAGLGQDRRALLRRLVSALPLSGDYALAEIIERDGTYIQCALSLASDAAEVADGVGAVASADRSRHWRFRFDEAAASAIGAALGRDVPSETPLQATPAQRGGSRPRLA